MERSTPRKNAEAGSFGARTFAILIDGAILALVGAVLGGLISAIDPFLLGTVGPLLGVGAIGYFVVLEGIAGQTVGKRIMGLSVIKANGAECDMAASVIRNVLRIVDSLPFGYLLGGLLIWQTSENQRLGDIVGNTVVVRTRS